MANRVLSGEVRGKVHVILSTTNIRDAVSSMYLMPISTCTLAMLYLLYEKKKSDPAVSSHLETMPDRHTEQCGRQPSQTRLNDARDVGKVER